MFVDDVDNVDGVIVLLWRGFDRDRDRDGDGDRDGDRDRDRVGIE